MNKFYFTFGNQDDKVSLNKIQGKLKRLILTILNYIDFDRFECMNKVEKNKFTGYLFLFLLPFLMLSVGCNTNKYLRSGETLVKKNKVVIKSENRVKNKRALLYELNSVIKQKPNKKWLGIAHTRLWAHYKVQQKIAETGDTSKWNKWVGRVIAEPPALYNEEITEATAQSMKYYLQHKGYNDAVVIDTVRHRSRRKRSIVTYTCYLNDIYKIDSVFFLSEDQKIKQILLDNSRQSLLKKGEAVSKSLFDKENIRVTNILRNSGYAYFNNSYFYAEGDTSQYKVNVYYKVLLPAREDEHRLYTVGDITVIPDYDANYKGEYTDTIINNILFLKVNDEIKVKSKNIINNLFLKTGDLYKEDNYIKTNIQLGALDIYSRVNIEPIEDENDPSKLNFIIRLTANKRMVFGADIELHNSTYNSNQTSLLGIAGSLNFRHRNLFRNAFLFLTELQGGFDLDLSNNDQLLYSVDLKAQGDLYMPRFVDPTKMWRGLKNARIIKSGFYNDLKEKARTRLTASYNYLSLFQFYSYNSFNFAFGYDLQRNSGNRYIINQFGVNYLQVDPKPDFKAILDDNPFLANSFDDQLFTGFFFKDFTYTHQGKTNNFGGSWFFTGNVELSGAEVFASNWAYNLSSGSDKTFSLFDRVEFAQFASLKLDGRYYKTLGPNQSLAFRLFSGIARPFGYSNEVPYAKQFYSGGPYSIRGWRIRELGPGQYLDPNTLPDADTIPFYQAADLQIEFNAEYRFKIFWLFEGALFIDGGNIWTIKEDPKRIGSQFRFKAKRDGDDNITNDNFIKQLAIGTGFGLRGDFTYFIIRFDMGIKLRTPYPNAANNNRYWRWNQLPNTSFKKDVNYNLAIGYPF